MRNPLSVQLAALAAASCIGCAATAAAVDYPKTRTVKQVDTYHGVEVPDPYRWLEDDVRESAAVREWVEAQNEVTFDYLAAIPERAPITARLTELWNYEKYGVPFKEGERYFFFLNDGLQNQSVLYTQKTLSDEPEILIDPNTWSADGTVALAGTRVSPDGRYLAYGIQDAGSDWRTWRVMDLVSRELLPDKLEWLKYTSVAWTEDGEGFFYARYPVPEEDAKYQSLNVNQKVYLHRIGTDQARDELVYERPDHPDWGFNTQVTEDGRFLVITVWKGTDDRYRIVYKDLRRPGSEPVVLIDKFENDYVLVGNDEDTLYFRTNRDAPKGRLVAIDVARPEPRNWREVVPESEDVLEAADYVGGRFVVQYLRDARAEVLVFERNGEPVGRVDFPGIGSAQGFAGKVDDPETFYAFSSFNAPTTIYRYDVATGKSEQMRRAKVDFDPDDYVVEQVFYRSKDGTQVPMFIAHRKGIELDGSNPTLLYGYGGFNISLEPGFSISRLAWMEMGGVYAVANLRGGGEYGEAWHEAGTRLKKQNVFDDFIAAGEYLVEHKYTRPEKLAIFGGSNGGLLVAAASNQRPDLFAAALPAVGVMDMLRFHKFTAGRFWVDDYGSADDPREFEALYRYSPYHNVRKGVAYPATLVTTADTDDRVVPAHSFKYIAALQDAHAGEAPVLIRIETRAGHGAGTPTDKIIEEYADRWAFLVHNLDMKLPPADGTHRLSGLGSEQK